MGERSPKVSVAVFDVGGVLLEWNPRYLYRKLFDDDAEMEAFLSEICSPAWNLAMDAGRSFADGVADLVGRFPEKANLIRAYDERWEEMVPRAIDLTVDVLAELKAADRPVYAVTNFSSQKFAGEVERWPFLRWFDGILVSGDEGIVKPNPAIFRLLWRAIRPCPAGLRDDRRCAGQHRSGPHHRNVGHCLPRHGQPSGRSQGNRAPLRRRSPGEPCGFCRWLPRFAEIPVEGKGIIPSRDENNSSRPCCLRRPAPPPGHPMTLCWTGWPGGGAGWAEFIAFRDQDDRVSGRAAFATIRASACPGGD